MEAQYIRAAVSGPSTFRKVKFSITAESRPERVLKIRRENHGWSLRHQKVLVGMNLNCFFNWICRPCHVWSYTKGFEKVWYAWAQHKVESKAWSCLVDLPPIAMECGFMRMLRSSGDLGTFFFGIWRIWVIFLKRKILCIGWNYIFKVEIWQNFAKTTTLVWRIGYTRIGWALGRIASTIFFCGKFFSNLRNVFVKNLEM